MEPAITKSKRRFLSGTFSLGIGLLLVWSLWIEPSSLTTRFEKFSWKNEPLRIVHFSDLHAGSPHIDLDYVRKLVGEINRQKPDLILITGDFAINNIPGGHKIPFAAVASELKKLQAKLGIFSVLGNHDWWNDTASIQASLEKNGILILENRSLTITYGTHSRIQLIGVGDDFTGHSALTRAFQGVNPTDPRILMTHDPGAILDLQPALGERFDLALAGHMHGGQVNFPILGALVTPGRAPRAWAQGWTTIRDVGQLFVTRGIGTSILPIRFNAPPEFVVFDFLTE